MDNIKNCPFCGEKARVRDYKDVEFLIDHTDCYMVQCDGCGCGTSYEDTEAKAVSTWNMRLNLTSKKPDMLGLHAKYNVSKVVDGTPVFNSFVLRPEIDPAARVALRAYAGATQNALLAKDIELWMDDLDAPTGAESEADHAE